jgi:phage terminase small subunit
MRKPGELTRAQKLFCLYFLENDGRNQTEAYMRAYPKASYDSARTNAARMLANANIQAEISSQIEGLLKKSKLTLEKRLFDFWMRRAFFDVKDILDYSGNFKEPIETLGEKGLSVCIDQIKAKYNGRGGKYAEVVLADREKAADQLQKYIQMIKPAKQEVELSGSLSAVPGDYEERRKLIEELEKKEEAAGGIR